MTDYQKYGQELGEVVALSELLGEYIGFLKSQSKGKRVKQNDKALVKVLKNEYELSSEETDQILSLVSGKRKGSSVVSSGKADELKNRVNGMIENMGIRIRGAETMDEVEYLKKVKANLSVRKGKALNMLNPGREKRRGRPRKEA